MLKSGNFWPQRFQLACPLFQVWTVGGPKNKSQTFDGCPMDSHFIGLGLLRTVFEIAVACREGPAPEFCCIAGDIEGGSFQKIVPAQ